ncbi:diphthamide synthase [Citrus sinensis]|uniref:diphthine--ammonia ligase isoform X2 n=1 Tax=Citrus sinensis TaxID=2711 RepID=UPI000CED65FD|nr:diphthine--ammonia ligase isoform X2 [Citrus sinensis]XP_024045354.1 diphthine--ammonia ligase isoform X2 [Citrus x clementina]KAH9658894.1 diphthamide synthase [Citrus sinensis]
MKVVALVSGGKDSCYAMMKCIQYGHQIVALANLMPADDSVDELDSYMYQTVGHQIIVSYAECMGLPLFRRRIHGSTRHQKLSYRMTPGDEVEDMYILLNEVKRQIPSVTAVSSGAIASDYQRLRVESVCSRLGLVSLAYLWKQDQSLLLQEMITNGINAITVKVAAMGLEPGKHLGKEIAFLDPYLHKLKESYGINVCGEGGEYETLTLDCPLFVNARIVLDEFQVVLHSADSIAPVGVLHPLAFHLEYKAGSASLSGRRETENSIQEKTGLVFEVQGECPQNSEAMCLPVAEVTDSVEVTDNRLNISRTKKDNTFSICCWLQETQKTSAGLLDDLRVVLKQIESKLVRYGFDWGHVLYIHLYISDMNEFAVANETYVKFITHEKCPCGVPSRSTIELPLLEVGLGKAYIEVLVANDQSKRVLHVQSISCWAPSCIGPYSQATLHKEVLQMAGQLGLDPPTMTLCNGGPTVELEQALQNSEAVAKCFNCSISTSAIYFVVYCSTYVASSERLKIQEKLDAFLKQMRVWHFEERSMSKVLDPIFLFVLASNLPKSAFVEIKPILYVTDDSETVSEIVQDLSCMKAPSHWGFQHADWHESCFQKCVVHEKICAVILSITCEIAARICSESLDAGQSKDCQTSQADGGMGRLSRFCIYLLNKIIVENNFSWEDVTNLRLYFPTSLSMPMVTLSAIFSSAFDELAVMNPRMKIDGDSIFNLVPVLGAGRSATMDDIITCELFAQKS